MLTFRIFHLRLLHSEGIFKQALVLCQIELVFFIGTLLQNYLVYKFFLEIYTPSQLDDHTNFNLVTLIVNSTVPFAANRNQAL